MNLTYTAHVLAPRIHDILPVLELAAADLALDVIDHLLWQLISRVALRSRQPLPRPVNA